MKKFIGLCLCLIAVASVLGQSRSKPTKQQRPVKQSREVLEAYRVCTEFRRALAENFDFDRAYEATFTTDLTRRRNLAIAELEFDDALLEQLDDPTLVGLHKDLSQALVLSLPLFGAEDVDEFPSISARIDNPPKDVESFKSFAAELKHELADLRVYMDKLAAKNPSVANNIREYRTHLLKTLEPPNRVVKPMTGYSKGRVLRPDEEYYQIDDCAVVRERGQMKLIGYRFITLRF